MSANTFSQLDYKPLTSLPLTFTSCIAFIMSSSGLELLVCENNKHVPDPVCFKVRELVLKPLAVIAGNSSHMIIHLNIYRDSMDIDAPLVNIAGNHNNLHFGIKFICRNVKVNSPVIIMAGTTS